MEGQSGSSCNGLGKRARAEGYSVEREPAFQGSGQPGLSWVLREVCTEDLPFRAARMDQAMVSGKLELGVRSFIPQPDCHIRKDLERLEFTTVT